MYQLINTNQLIHRLIAFAGIVYIKKKKFDKDKNKYLLLIENICILGALRAGRVNLVLAIYASNKDGWFYSPVVFLIQANSLIV